MRELSDGEREKLAEMKIDQVSTILHSVYLKVEVKRENNLIEVKERIACALKLMEEALELGAAEFREAKIRERRREEIEKHRRELEVKMIKPYEGNVEDLKNMHVEELGLTVRTSNVLRNMNIKSVYELIQYTASRLYKSRNMGKKSIEELERKLAEIGLMLKQEEV